MAGYRSYRQLRIFVSSTFQDMQAERSILVGKVFPVIAEYCHRKKVEFTGVDLRWGVTDEQSQRGETVDICMAEIDKCRPLFMGMLGERYGWVPDGNGISVTEQEVLYGALEAPEDTEALFYLRDPELTRTLCGDFQPDGRQDELKDRIRASRYPVMDCYADLDSFEKQLIRDLKAVVDRMVRAEAPVSAEQDRRMQHRFMAERYATGHVRREALTAKLDELASDGGLVLVTGASGMGKTSLVSDWALGKIAESEEAGVMPDAAVTQPLIFLYYAGSADEKGWEQMCRQLIYEIKTGCGMDYPEAETADELRRTVHILMNMAAAGRRLIIVIDQPEALEDGSAQGMAWLPGKLPEGVTVVVSADESDTLDRLRQRAHTELAVEKLSVPEVTDIAEEYLAGYSKSLSSEHLAMLEACDDARDPLYLITVLNEVRHTGRHEELTGQLAYYLSSRGTGELFDKVLRRFDSEYDDEGTKLPERMLTMMEVCRGGIGEAELISMLGDVPQARLAPLRLAMDMFTAVSTGAMHICVPEFRNAVLGHYGIDEECIHEAREELAEWFSSHEDTPRRSYALPYLLRDLGRYGDLAVLISEPACLAEILERDRYELKEYWAELATEGYIPSELYSGLIYSEEWDYKLMTDLAELLAGAGAAETAKEILERITGFSGGRENISEETRNIEGKAGNNASSAGMPKSSSYSGSCKNEKIRCRALGILGNIYMKEGSAVLAYRTYGAKLASARRTGDRHEQMRALGNIGIISMMQGDKASAGQAFGNVLSIGERLNNKEAVQIALGNLGNIAFSSDDPEEAERLFRRQLEVSTESGNIAGMMNACGALGVVHLKRGDLKQADEEFSMQEELSRRIGAPDSLANALGNKATIREAEGLCSEAEDLLNEKLEICRKEKMPAGEQNALGNLVTLAAAREGGLEEALGLAKQRVDVTLRSRMIRQYAEALNQLADIEEKLSLDEDADTHWKKAEIIARQHGFRL